MKHIRGFLLLTAILCSSRLAAQDQLPSARHYFYLSDQRIITVELINREKAILNYINLGENFELIEATKLLVLDKAGKPYYGHLIRNEKPTEEENRYLVTDLIKPREYRGYEILGNFHIESPPSAVYLRLGSRTAKLEPLSQEDFELNAGKIGEIDLSAADPKRSLIDAGFWQGYGKLYYAGDEEMANVNPFFKREDPYPPVVIADPRPRLPRNSQSLPDPVLVHVSARVTAAGGILDTRVKDGINAELDQLAVEVVQNSWKILPAIAGGKVAEATLVLNVVFERSN